MKRRRSTHRQQSTSPVWLCLLLTVFASNCSAARVNFQNCVDTPIDPGALHFTPYIVDAKFTEDTTHTLSFEVYGNVSSGGQIVDSQDEIYTTLKTTINVLSYTPYIPPSQQLLAFCNATTNGYSCPIGPVSNVNISDPSTLPGFTFSNEMQTSFSFSTLSTTFLIKSPTNPVMIISCIEVDVTPWLGLSLTNILIYIPLAILIITGIATVLAAVYNPWNGTKDVFAWSSNFGRDADMLRLVTPGFADCLQYLQFIFLTGGLTLNYPGFYQPVVSKAAWSMLLFNMSMVTHESKTRLVDNIYTNNATYGLESLSQLVGIGTGQDIWAGFMIIFAAVVAFILVCGFLMATLRWGLKRVRVFDSGDLRAKNLPFLGGLMIRLIFNYLFQPILVFSAFQLLLAGRGPLSINIVAGIVLVALIVIAAIVIRMISAYKPRSPLYDDLPTLLLYGPLYNTYDESATLFCIVYLAIATLRSVTIGFIQPSGIAQLVLLAICEIIMILTLNAFRPYSPKTSMNLYQTFFSVIRLITVLFQVTFVPSLQIGYTARGWIGYAILLLHGVVLIFGFFMNAVQTIVEVLARLAGAGESGAEGDAMRGGLAKVFGKRQLARRMNRRDAHVSQANGQEQVGGIEDRKMSFMTGTNRPGSLSGSSAILLNNGLPLTPGTDRLSGPPENISTGGFGHNHTSSTSTGFTPNTPRRASNYSYFESAPSISLNNGTASASLANRASGLGVPIVAGEAAPFYRPPRKSRPVSNSRTRSSGGPVESSDWYNISTGGPSSHNIPNYSRASDGIVGGIMDGGGGGEDEWEGTGGNQPMAPALTRDRLAESSSSDPRRTDYAVREGDFYYGVRGPALSTLPTRKLGTGPADPTGPVTVAKGWFMKRFGKGKENNKGFEVVRSARAPLPVRAPIIDDDSHGATSPTEPLAPEPSEHQTYNGAEEIESPVEERGKGIYDATQNEEDMDDEESDYTESDDEDEGVGAARPLSQLSPLPPVLPEIQIGNDIELSKRPSHRSDRSIKPNVPRKSSRRKSALMSKAATYKAVPQGSVSAVPANLYDPPIHPNLSGTSAHRLPFSSSREVTDGAALGQPGDRTSYADSSDGSALAPAALSKDDNEEGSAGRPASMGNVHRVKVGDVMHIGEPRYLGLGSTAEVVESRERNRSPSVISAANSNTSTATGVSGEAGTGTLAEAVKSAVKRKEVPKR